MQFGKGVRAVGVVGELGEKRRREGEKEESKRRESGRGRRFSRKMGFVGG